MCVNLRTKFQVSSILDKGGMEVILPHLPHKNKP